MATTTETPLREQGDNSTYDCRGKDTEGQRYASISEMWDTEVPGQEARCGWYDKSSAYWTRQPASVEGMLGGLGVLHARDVAASRRFLDSLSPHAGRGRVLDVGAGIGRVTKHFLLPLFSVVDMLEQNALYLQQSKKYVSPATSEDGKVGLRIAAGMQDFRSDGTELLTVDGDAVGCLDGAYDAIWIQWTVGYLTDEDFVTFVRQCVRALRKADDAYVVIKDNVARAGFIVDRDDSSIMRSHAYMGELFRRARVRVVKTVRQADFPRGIHPVRAYAVRPAEDFEVPSVGASGGGGTGDDGGSM